MGLSSSMSEPDSFLEKDRRLKPLRVAHDSFTAPISPSEEELRLWETGGAISPFSAFDMVSATRRHGAEARQIWPVAVESARQQWTRSAWWYLQLISSCKSKPHERSALTNKTKLLEITREHFFQVQAGFLPLLILWYRQSLRASKASATCWWSQHQVSELR